jgi:hypothetical protein
MNSKKGSILGSATTMFFATIIIVIILFILIIGSFVVKGMVRRADYVRVLNESEVGIVNVFGYMNNYVKLVELRFFIEKGAGLDKAIDEVGYEE